MLSLLQKFCEKDKLPEWHQIYKKDIDAMWNEECMGIFAQVVCKVCGGGVAGTCKCAKERFLKDLKIERLVAYMGDWRTKYATEIKEMWEKRKKLINSVTRMNCNICNDDCDCAEKAFNVALKYKDLERYLEKKNNQK